MADTVSKEKRSQIMAKVRSTNTGLELAVFRDLRRNKISFQRHYSKVIGKPDIALPAAKKAVFIHSDFWHGWQYPKWRERLSTDFWRDKIDRNRNRDRKVTRRLRFMKWKVLIIWEHSLNKNWEATIDRIVRFLRS